MHNLPIYINLVLQFVSQHLYFLLYRPKKSQSCVYQAFIIYERCNQYQMFAIIQFVHVLFILLPKILFWLLVVNLLILQHVILEITKTINYQIFDLSKEIHVLNLNFHKMLQFSKNDLLA